MLIYLLPQETREENTNGNHMNDLLSEDGRDLSLVLLMIYPTRAESNNTFMFLYSFVDLRSYQLQHECFK